MDFRIALEWDERCGISNNNISSLREGIENAFLKKQYGMSISQIWIVLSCRDKPFNQRKRYRRDIHRLEYDILINYSLIEGADIKDKKSIIKREVIMLTEQTFSTYKFENFDKSSFLIDFKEVVESIEWLETASTMINAENKVEELRKFIENDKFSNSVWKEIGLNPSPVNLSNNLSTLLNQCACNLIKAINNNAASSELKLVLIDGLSIFDKQEIDTEERELVCEYFYKLSAIVNIEFQDELSNWLYSPQITRLNKNNQRGNLIKSDDIIVSPCARCGSE